MRDVKLLNGALWGLNGILGAGILAFAWFFLLFPKDANPLRDARWDDEPFHLPPGPLGGDDTILKTLGNPIERQVEKSPSTSPTLFKAILKGTFASEKDPKAGVAFIRSMMRNVELVAYVGEEIKDGDKPYEEFRGWKLAEVGKSRATFSNGVQQQTLTLNLEASAYGGAPGAGGPGAAVGPGKTARIGQAYQSANFKSQLLADTPNRVVWQLDPEEIDWAMQNQDAIMDQAFLVSPSASGGIRIDSVQAGSIGAARGMIAGDIIRDVNGQALNSIQDVKALMTSPAMRAQTGMRITVERAGKPMVIEYRPMGR